MDLRTYQQDARAAVRERETAGVRSLLTVLPTGTGKTVLFASEVAERAQQGRVLVLAHRDELVQQPRDTLRRVAPGLEVGIVQAEKNEVAARVVVASVQSLCQSKRLEAYAAHGLPLLVVTDEAHHAPASTYRRIYEALQVGAPHGPLHLGYTATPERLDGVGLGAVFQEVAYSSDIRKMVCDGWLVEPRGRIVGVAMDLDAMRRKGSDDYSDSDLDGAMSPAVLRAIAGAWMAHGRDRTSIAFLPSVRTARDLASAVNSLAGEEVAAEVDGNTPTDERRDILHRLQAGRIGLVANCGVLTEGFDAPKVSCILVARPTKSEGLYVQMVGRGLRLYPGKSDCLVLDVTGISATHSLCVLPVLFGLDPEDMEGRTVAEEAAKQAARHGAQAPRKVALATQDQAVDLLQRRRRWAWAEVHPGRVYSVSLPRDDGGEQRLVVVREARSEPGTWIAEVRRYLGRSLFGAETLYSGTGDGAAEDAFGEAETFLARQPPAARRLASGAADGWRAAAADLPPTPAQLSALQRWRVAVPHGLSRAGASDLLDQAISAARLRRA